MFWLIPLLIGVAFSILGQLLAPKVAGPKPDDTPKIPDIDETRSIPVLWGEWLIQNPQLFWWGDYRSEPITKKVFTGLWFKKTTIGFKYMLGGAFGLSAAGTHQHPLAGGGFSGIEKITEIQIGEKVVWQGDAGQNQTITIDNPAFFGGNKDGGNGGVKAEIEVHTGGYTPAQNQIKSPYLQTQLARTPTWTGLAYAVWKGPSAGSGVGYYGNSSSIQTIAFKAVRRPNLGIFLPPPMTGTETFATIDGLNGELDANPVHCLAELLIDEDWGMGGDLTEDDFDTVSWRAAAETVYNEGNGFSFYWDKQTSCEEMAEIMLRQIDGVVYTDYATGKIKIKLARADYDIDDLPVFGNENFIEISELSRGSWDDTINEVRVTYTDHKKNFKSISVFDNDLANFVIQENEGISSNINYPGVSNEALARALARRDLRVLAQPLLRFTGTVDRTAHALRPGDLFVFEWPEQGIEAVVMRVTTAHVGTLESGVIQIECVEDKFDAAVALFTETSGGWTEPSGGTALDASPAALDETPFYYQRDDLQRPFSLAARPNASHTSYQFTVGADVLDDFVDFTPTGTLRANYGPYLATGDPTGFTVENMVNREFVPTTPDIASGGGLIIVGSEWMSYGSVTLNVDGSITVKDITPGAVDTRPVRHVTGERVWFVNAALGQVENDYDFNVSVSAKFLTQTSNNVLATGSATAHAKTMKRRALKPYAPGPTHINASYTTLTIPNTGNVVFGWVERNRTEDTILAPSGWDTNRDPELSTTYILKIYGDANVLLRTVTDIAPGTVSFTYTNAMETADAGSLQGVLTFVLYAKRFGLHSYQPFYRVVTRTGGVIPASYPAYAPVDSYTPPAEGSVIAGIPVSSTPPTTGQVLVYNPTTGLWTPTNASGIAGGGVTVEEYDGAPTVANVIKIKVQNYTLVNEGSGVVRLDPNLDLILTLDGEVVVDEGTGEVVYWL